MNNTKNQPRWLRHLLSASLLLMTSHASALTQEITAKFVPDPANPMKNEFVNTTPQSGVCEWHASAIPLCLALGIFSIRSDNFWADSNGPILANHQDPRQGAMWKVPSEWRDLQVTHRETGEVETVQVRIAGIGHRWNLDRPPGVSAWNLPNVNWQSQWKQAPSPCRSIDYIAAGVSYALFFWIVPENAGVCHRTPGTDIPKFWYSNIEYAYAIKTPRPLQMSTGQYVGSINYSMGPMGDFDFGDVMIPRDTQLTFNFTLDVQHSLDVKIPPGGHRVELVPQGGWQAWLNHGRKPERLFRDQTFNISSSSRFKMNLECEHSTGGNTCALWEPKSDHRVPLKVSITLPNGLVDANQQAVVRRPLFVDGSGTQLIQPTYYVDRKPATLHFEIAREQVEQMLTGEGKTYSGNVTVVWDSQV
ncbi:hypothetical protein [Pseudomonas sp. MYb118]|uniref:hypothetical protein n=1 Tax=Pseudomonas sp. MYb118 TaxID=1848720 RepID=UPI0034CFF7C9